MLLSEPFGDPFGALSDLTRRLSLSENLDLDHIQAHYDRGVAYLRIP